MPSATPRILASGSAADHLLCRNVQIGDADCDELTTATSATELSVKLPPCWRHDTTGPRPVHRSATRAAAPRRHAAIHDFRRAVVGHRHCDDDGRVFRHSRDFPEGPWRPGARARRVYCAAGARAVPHRVDLGTRLSSVSVRATFVHAPVGVGANPGRPGIVDDDRAAPD